MAASQVMARAQLHRGPGRPPSRPYAAQTTTAGSQAAIHAAVVQQQHINRQMTRGPNQRVDKVIHCSHHVGPTARCRAGNALPVSMRPGAGAACTVRRQQHPLRAVRRPGCMLRTPALPSAP